MLDASCSSAVCWCCCTPGWILAASQWITNVGGTPQGGSPVPILMLPDPSELKPSTVICLQSCLQCCLSCCKRRTHLCGSPWGCLHENTNGFLSEHCLKSVSLKNTLIVSVRKLFSSNPHSHFPEQEENVAQNQEWKHSQADPSS